MVEMSGCVFFSYILSHSQWFIPISIYDPRFSSQRKQCLMDIQIET